MNKTRQAVIKRIGNGVVDVQPVGSANVIKNVKVSGQISWDLLTPGTNVVLDELSQLPIVTHTIAVGPQYYGSHGQSYTNVINNALLADGSVALVGNLPVAPGVTVDGYDISLLGQAIVNLQAADTIARTGYTVLSHATHLVATIDADATTIMVRDALFDDGEEIALSNTEGHVEYMIINGAPVLTVDNQGAPAWNYTVFRRSYTDPPNIEIGWAAATLINGLTTKGFIYMDGRGGSDKAPSINVTVIPNPVTHTKNQVVAIGNLSGLLDFEDDSYGLAVGRLSTADIYFSFNNRTAELKLANADITGSSGTGSESEEYYRIFGLFEDDHMPGDVRFGGDGGRLELWNETHKLAMLNGDAEIFTIDPSGARFMNMVWAGSIPGPQVGIGQDGSNAVIALRGEIGSAGFVATGSADGRVYVYTGNPPPLPNHWYYDSLTNKAGFDGDFTVRNMRVEGQIQFSSVGSVKVLNPSDPLRYGMIVPHGQYGYSVDAGGQQFVSSVTAWAPVVLDTEPGLTGYTHTYTAGEAQLGRRRYRHFRVEPGATGRVGLFDGDNPLVWADYLGNSYIKGILYTSDESIRLGFDDRGLEQLLPYGDIDNVKNLVTFVDEDYKTYSGIWGGYYETTPGSGINQIHMHVGTFARDTAINDARSYVRLLSNSHAGRQAKVTIQSSGDNGSAATAMIELISYGGDDGNYGLVRFTGMPRLTRQATEPTGTSGQALSNGLFGYPDGTVWDPLTYIADDYLVARLGGDWVPLAQAWGTEWRWGNGSTNYTAIDGTGTQTYVGTARTFPRYKIVTKPSGSFNVDVTEASRYRVNASGGATVATLPTADATNKGTRIKFSKVDSSANTVTISTVASGNIVLSTQWSYCEVEAQDSTWERVG